jgi:hypothetical protein
LLELPLASFSSRCKAWIRLALNEVALDNYFEILLCDAPLLSSSYASGAFMRDQDHDKPEIIRQVSPQTHLLIRVYICERFLLFFSLVETNWRGQVLKGLLPFKFTLSVGDLCEIAPSLPPQTLADTPVAVVAADLSVPCVVPFFFCCFSFSFFF